jgi:tyrosine-protein kinase Etk/Wzc
MKKDQNFERDFIDYLVILGKWRMKIILSTMVVLIAAIIFSFIIPKKYKATVLFLPPTTSSGLSSLIENMSFDLFGSDNITGEMCLSVLNSRVLRTEIINKYNLMKLYNKKYIEHAIKELDKNVLIQSEVQMGIGTSTINSISISVIDKQPERAADIANDLLKLLESKIIELNTKKAQNNRFFLEKRVNENAFDLIKIEDSLKVFQEKYGTIDISSQAKVAIESAAKLKAELIKTKIVRDAMSNTYGNDNTNVKEIQNEINAISKEYQRLYDGNNELLNSEDIMIPFTEMPNIGLQYSRLLREVKVRNKLNEMLIPLYEQAKIQEEKTIPVLRVIDYAIPPTYKFKPKRIVIVLGIVAVYFSVLMLYIFYKEYIDHLKIDDNEKYKKLRKFLIN